MKNLLRNVLGIVLLVLGGFLAVSCLTYHATDSSFNAAGTFETKNLMGSLGASAADLSLQLFGVAAFILPVACVVFGLFLLKRVKWISFRFTMFLTAFLASAWLLCDTQPSLDSSWLKAGSGGFVGYFFNSFFTLESVFYRFIGYAVIALCFIFSLKVPVKLLSKKVATGVAAMPKMPLKKVMLPIALKKVQKETVESVEEPVSQEEDDDSLEQPQEEPQPKKKIGFLLRKKEKEAVAPRVEPSFDLMGDSDDAPSLQDDEEKSAPQRVEKQKIKETMPKSIQKESDNNDKNALELPSSQLLDPVKAGKTQELSREAMDHISRALENVLAQFGVKGEIVGAHPGPVVTLYEFLPAAGIKSARIISLADDIAMKMSVKDVRMAVIPGSCYIGIEMPNKNREAVYIREMIEDVSFQTHSGALPLILGKDIGGNPVFADLAKMPHLLVAGTTGSGKSVGINTMVMSLLYRFTPAECRMIMVDPKVVELSVYNRIPHLLTPVVTEPAKAVIALKWAVQEMEDRYRAMAVVGSRNIEGYNQKLVQAAREGKSLTRRVQTGFDPETGRPVYEEQQFDSTPIPYIVIIVDEFADLMGQCGKEVDPLIQRLAQKARAVGIHLILATQRPSVDVITGTIKSNFPTRISFRVIGKVDSRTILDTMGAERLLGKGDMLYMSAGSAPQRVHGPYVSDEEVERVVSHWEMQAEPEYVAAVTMDVESSSSGGGNMASVGGESEGGDLYDRAVAIVLRDKKPTTSYVQRALRIGYNKAADLIDRMEAEGIISKPNIAGKREIIVPTDNA